MRLIRSIPAATFALVVAGAFAQTGCIQSDAKTALNADGSGTQTDTMSIDIQKIKDLMEMGKAFGGGSPGGPGGGAPGGGAGPAIPDMDIEKGMDAAFTEDEIRKQMKEIPGVEIKNVKTEKKDGKRTVMTEIAFKDFSTLGKGNQSTAVDLVKNEDGTWTLTYDSMGGQGGALSGGGGKEGGAEGMPAGMDMSAMLPMLEPFIGTLEMKRAITLPGEIVETNGVKGEDGKSVSWKFTFKDMATPAKDGKAVGAMMVRFKGDGLSLKPFSYKPDPKEAMKKFEAPTTPGEPKPDAPVAPVTPDAPKAP